jgi:hypothetical protein
MANQPLGDATGEGASLGIRPRKLAIEFGRASALVEVDLPIFGTPHVSHWRSPSHCRRQRVEFQLPLAKELADFEFAGTPVNEALVRELAAGTFLANQRNAVLVGCTGTGKTHLAVAIARSCIRGGARARFYNVVDLVNRLEGEARASGQGRLADHLARLDLVILDELGHLPFAQSGRPAPLPPDQPAL